MNLTNYRNVFFFVGIIVCLVITLAACIGEPCEKMVGKEMIQFNHYSDVDSIKIEKQRLFTKNEYEGGSVIYDSRWRHFDTDSIDITVYINLVSTQMSFAVKNNKTLYVTLSDTAAFVCGSIPPYQWLKRNNAAACIYYDSLSCP